MSSRRRTSSNSSTSRILEDGIIGLAWMDSDSGMNGWSYINSEGNLISDDEAEEQIATLDIFNPVDTMLGSNYMVKFPAGIIDAWTGVSGTDAEGKFCIAVGSISKLSGSFIRHPAFYNYRTGKAINEVYIGKYKSSGASGSAANSLPNVKPVVSITAPNFYATCAKVGTDYHCLTFYERYWVGTLMLIESKGDIIGKHGYGSIQGSVVLTGSSGKFILGLDDFYNNCYEWLDGIHQNTSSITLPKPGTVAWTSSNNTSTNYISAGFNFSNNGYQQGILNQEISSLGFNTNILLIGSTTHGKSYSKSTCYIPDYQYNSRNATNIYGLSGGCYSADDYVCAFNVNVNRSPSSTTTNIGGRLARW